MSSDPRFNYQDIGPPGITVAQLDSIFNAVFTPSMNPLTLVVSGIKLALAVAYLIARDRLVAATQEYAKQKYEAGNAAQNQNDVNNALPVTK